MSSWAVTALTSAHNSFHCAAIAVPPLTLFCLVTCRSFPSGTLGQYMCAFCLQAPHDMQVACKSWSCHVIQQSLYLPHVVMCSVNSRDPIQADRMSEICAKSIALGLLPDWSCEVMQVCDWQSLHTEICCVQGAHVPLNATSTGGLQERCMIIT